MAIAIRLPKPLAYVLFALPWLATVVAFVWVLIQRFPPSGVFIAQSVLDGTSSWIHPFLPAERASTPGKQPDGWVGQRVIDDPVYFTALVPGPYETVDVTLEFRPIGQPFLEFGMVHDAEGKDLELRPLYFAGLQSANWRKGAYQGKVGYIRKDKPLTRLADAEPQGLAVWNTTSTPVTLHDLPAEEAVQTVSLRGAHDFYFVPTDELKATFVLQAANRQKGNDLAAFRVFCGDEEIAQQAFTASGSQDERMGKQFEHTISVKPAKDCIYRISFKASDDVFIRSVKTPSRRWVIGPRLVFGDTVGYSTTTFPGIAWTNSRHIVAETFHNEGLQEIVFGPLKPKLKKTHTRVRADRSDDAQVVMLKAPQGDVRFIGDGYFALRPEAFFEPQPRRLTDGTDLNAERMDAVLTDYAKPEDIGNGWFRATFRFSLNPTLDNLRFVLSAPGVVARSAAVDVRRVILEYRRPAASLDDWFRVLRQELANAWRRL